MARPPAERPRRSGGRVPPHNLQAEESVLGALLLSRDAIGSVSEAALNPSDFYKPSHQHIFDAVKALYNAGAPVDTITVAEELRRAGLLDQVGGTEGLHGLQNATPAISNAAHYARIVQDTAVLRRLILVAGDIVEMAYSEPDDVTKAVDEAEGKVFRVAEDRVTDSTQELSELLKGAMDRLEETFARGDTITGTATGYHDLDELLSGLQPSTLNIVGARPAIGKTSFALGMATHVAQTTGRPVLVFSLEMGHAELTERILSSEAKVDTKLLRTGRLTEADWAKIGRAIGRLEVPLFLDDNPRVTVMEIRAKARRMKARHGGLALIVIDYLQLMTGGGSAENRQLEVSEISRSLKILARELEVPIVALSQLSRNLETRSDKRPMLSDLRESGCLTADTRLVRADTNGEVTLGELVASGATDVAVWSLDERYRLVPARLTCAFSSGVKHVFRLRLASGRFVDASANHPFLTLDGWQRLDDLRPRDHIAVARRVPSAGGAADEPPMADAELVLLAHLIDDGCVVDRHGVHCPTADLAGAGAVVAAARALGIEAHIRRDRGASGVCLPGARRGRRHPIVDWLDELGATSARTAQLTIPGRVLQQPAPGIALFLRHLWSGDRRTTDGAPPIPGTSFATSERDVADDVASLLLRLDICARVRRVPGVRGRPAYRVEVSGREDQLRFAEVVGVHGAAAQVALDRVLSLLGTRRAAPCADAIPAMVWEHVRTKAMPASGVDERQLAVAIGLAPGWSLPSEAAISRPRLQRVAAVTDDSWLHDLATSDVCWDRIVEITPRGPQPVYDATIDVTHNFLANGVVAHNSLEQDADVVMFLYRDEVYNNESADKGSAEVIVAKHRSGPIGSKRLVFLGQYTRFDNAARGV